MHKMRHSPHALRIKAEKELAKRAPAVPPGNSVDELLYELQVHQIELEMQNESLQRAQVQLADSYHRYVELYDFAPVGYLTLTGEGIISQINSTCAELLGQPRESCLRRHFKYFIAPKFHESVDQLLTNNSRKIPRQRTELVLKRGDGSEFHAELVCRLITPQEGLPVWHVALMDISDRKRAEQQLRIAATAFEAQEGILVMSHEHIILRVNSAFSKITGYPAEEALGLKLGLIYSARYNESFFAAMWDAVRKQGVWQGEVWSQRKSGDDFPSWLTITAVTDDSREITHYVVTLTDNTLRKEEEEKIKQLAFYDSLTQLPNRQLLLNRLQQALASSIRSGRDGALLFIDLDNFKMVNDTLGHSMGDLLLKQVATRLNTCIREGDTVARLGGDEFVVMLEGLSENIQEAAAQIEVVGEKILTALNKTYDLGGHHYHSTPSIGASLFHEQRNSMEDLLKSADLAMYHAKAAGRNVLRFFDLEMQAKVDERIRQETEMREGFGKGQFLVHYQPQVDDNGRWIGVEALLRWQRPGRNLLASSEFIELAVDSGLIVPIGQWVLETVCRQLTVWSTQDAFAHLTIAVNVSPREFRHPEFVNNVISTLRRCGTNPQRLCLEVTDELLGHGLDEVAVKMSALKSAGVHLSLNNIGYGALLVSKLKRFPLDQLIIGKPFVTSIPNDKYDLAIANSIIALGEKIGLEVIAEGVETSEQHDALFGLNCHYFQGNLFNRVVSADALTEMTTKSHSGFSSSDF
jgi:diguanylate cyclase (GGDEF)-like protein/PAS domain S-box-containing protein